MQSKQTLVLGGPGCGKTTRLLDILENVLKSGIAPNEVAFLAFTRKAAHEARERAAQRFGFAEDELPYFKTLHALAFGQLGLATNEVMGKGDYATIGKSLGWSVEQPDDESGLYDSQDQLGGKVAFLEQMARLTGRSIEGICLEQDSERYFDVRLYADTLSRYKASRHALDFTDMLAAYLEKGPFPKVRVVFIDEAQDLSPIQWKLVERIIDGVEAVYFGGDDDQAIYEWSGADVNHFLHLKGERIVLPHSHRLPRVVFDKANDILSRIQARFEKTWSPARDGGLVEFYSEIDYTKPQQDGTWLYLARNRYMLSRYTEFLREQGLPYNLLGRSSVDNDTVRAIICWEQLRRGKPQPEKSVKALLGMLRPGHSAKLPHTTGPEISFGDLGDGLSSSEDWMSAIRMTDEDREYYRSILRNRESLIKPPRISVSTIHQVKGGEADHVVLMSDMSYSCYKQLQNNPDSEHRVFYVGATRARQSLHVIYPTTNKHYQL